MILFVIFIGIQFIRPNRTNPPIVESETLEASIKIPENIDEILKRSCSDCHTNKTDYPWYSNVAPVSWKVVEHIEDGRKHLNFSKWNTYSKERKMRKLEEVCEEIKSGEMPHSQYLWIHRDADLSENDKNTMCDWTESLSKSIGEN